MKYFQGVCEELGYAGTRIQRLLDRHYQEAGRHYHNLSHIEFMLTKLCKLERTGFLWGAIKEAVLWHDVCYAFEGAVRGENEIQSACLYYDHARSKDAALVVKMIAASMNHDISQKAAEQDPSLGLFLDLDLASFARPWDEYLIDAENVRKEIEPFTGTDAFLKGSMGFLAQLCERKAIYYQMLEWEEPARINILKRMGAACVGAGRAEGDGGNNMRPSAWGILTTVRPRTARREILQGLKEARAKLEADSVLGRYHKKLVLQYFDAFTDEIEGLLSGFIIFARPQWNKVFYVPLLIFCSSSLKDKCRNTAAITVDNALRVFGEKHGFLKTKQGEKHV